MIDKIKFIKPYLKDFIALTILILLALIFYDKLLGDIPDIPKLEPYNLSNREKTEEYQIKENDFSNLNKILSLFKEENIIEESETKIPTFEEVLFGTEYSNIKLIAITGTEKDKRALVIDHMNNLRTFRKGDKIDGNTIVSDITYTSVKFKSKNKTRELFLYKKEDFRKTSKTVSQQQPSIIRQQQVQEETIQDEEPIEEKSLESSKRPRRGIMR